MLKKLIIVKIVVWLGVFSYMQANSGMDYGILPSNQGLVNHS